MSSVHDEVHDDPAPNEGSFRASARQTETIMANLDQLETVLEDPSRQYDRSAVFGLLHAVREECTACMRPLPTCQEALLEIREMFRIISSNNKVDAANTDNVPDDVRERPPSVRITVHHDDWEYVNSKRSSDLQQHLHNLGPPWTDIVAVTKHPLKNINVLECFVGNEKQKEELSAVAGKTNGLHPFKNIFDLRHNPNLQKDIYEVAVLNVRFERKMSQAELDDKLYSWCHENNTSFDRVSYRQRSLRLYFTDIEKARALVNHGYFIIGAKMHKVAAWHRNFDRFQCYNCMKDGHSLKKCIEQYKKPVVCSWCAGPHHFNQCARDPREKKCANCSQAHCATDDRCADPEVVKDRKKRTARRGKGVYWMRNAPRVEPDGFVRVESNLNRGLALQADAAKNPRKPATAPPTAASNVPHKTPALPAGTKSLHHYFHTARVTPVNTVQPDLPLATTMDLSAPPRPDITQPVISTQISPETSRSLIETAKTVLFPPMLVNPPSPSKKRKLTIEPPTMPSLHSGLTTFEIISSNGRLDTPDNMEVDTAPSQIVIDTPGPLSLGPPSSHVSRSSTPDFMFNFTANAAKSQHSAPRQVIMDRRIRPITHRPQGMSLPHLAPSENLISGSRSVDQPESANDSQEGPPSVNQGVGFSSSSTDLREHQPIVHGHFLRRDPGIPSITQTTSQSFESHSQHSEAYDPIRSDVEYGLSDTTSEAFLKSMSCDPFVKPVGNHTIKLEHDSDSDMDDEIEDNYDHLAYMSQSAGPSPMMQPSRSQ
ncbi:uncharacterized protein K460DRAFT_89048 [Cucurbitaria berberidis CBS 394.84]|uniref:CCHC-type domain-containing protein n=1 Tax=Cucurbitaria berberidis CBS 394.84 TaxID=1168544 RepID=A0A9P4GQ77_9PLEO|nr:uncharacterized protein K460DRAFT_89048 [Cucurbitaria berberidis CBS 394.84]KAF1849324.1 hypothetical protein K460DRAFT_89048 [Cucurbitaria berberidis CBS 394.84]